MNYKKNPNFGNNDRSSDPDYRNRRGGFRTDYGMKKARRFMINIPPAA